MTTTGSIFRHTAIYSAATVVAKLVGFVMLPVYSRVFGTEGYAVLGMMDAATGLLAVLLSRAFSTAMVRNYHQEETAERRGTVLWTGIALVLMQAVVLLPLPMIMSGTLSSWLFGTGQYGAVVIMSCVSLAANMLGVSASMYLIINQRSVAYAAISVLRLFLSFFLCVLFVLVVKLGVVGVFVGDVITDVICAGVMTFPLWRKHPIRFDRGIAKDLIAFQWPLVPGDLISFISRQAERVLLRVLDTLKSVGVLEMGYKFPPLIGLFVTEPFLRAWRTKSMELGSKPEGPTAIGAMYTNYLFALAFGGLLLAVNLGTLLRLMTPEEFWGAVIVGELGILSTILTGCFSYLEFGLLFTGRTRMLSVIVGVKAVLKLGLSYLFISSWGLRGAALSAAVTDAFAVAWVWRASQRAYPLVFEWRRIGAIGVTAVGLFLFVQLAGGSCRRIAEAAAAPVRDALSGVIGARGLELLSLERAGGVLQLVITTIVASCFLLLMPYVRPGLATRLWCRARELAARGWRR